MNTRFSWFNVTSIVARLRVPLHPDPAAGDLLASTSSKLVTVWGGLSTKWYAGLLKNEALMDAAWVTLRVALVSATLATILGTLAAITLTRHGQLPRAHAVLGHGLRAARDARSHHRPVAAAAVRGHRASTAASGR